MKFRLKDKTLYIFYNRGQCELQQGGKYCSLKLVVQQIESWKARKTLRSAERAPTLSAACKQALLQLERGFSFYKTIVYYLSMKVDGQMSRVYRDKCPVDIYILVFYLHRTD